MSEKTTQVATLPKDKGEVSYEVAGQEVKLSYAIVRNFLTKGGGNVSDQDLVQFISICKFNQLNPFLGEAYLVKFGTTPAQMIVSKEALFKRAEANEKYQGFRAGIIVKRGNDVIELEGNFKLETDILLGGWAEVHRADRKFPVIAKISLKEYDKAQSTWKEKPLTMISKVAKVQAMREAFPSQLGAMYTQEEQTKPIDVTAEVVKHEVMDNANKEAFDFAEETPEPKKSKAEKKQEQKEEPATEFFNDGNPDF